MTAGASSWISMHGELWKVATENLRHATSEEKVGAELVEPMLGDMAEAISRRRRQRAYRDLTGDPVMPAEEEEDADMEDRGPPPVSISRADTADPGTGVPPTPSHASTPLERVEEEGEEELTTQEAAAPADMTERVRIISGDAPPGSARVISRSPPKALEGGSTSSGAAAPYGLNPVPLPKADDAESTSSGSKRARHLYVMLANGCEDFSMTSSDETFMVTDDGSFAYYVQTTAVSWWPRGKPTNFNGISRSVPRTGRSSRKPSRRKSPKS